MVTILNAMLNYELSMESDLNIFNRFELEYLVKIYIQIKISNYLKSNICNLVGFIFELK